MRRGDVVFFKADGTLLERAIAWCTKSELIHVALVISADLEEKHGIIVEANGFIKTRQREFTYDPSRHVLYRVPNLTETQINSICSYALSVEGTGYDYWQIVGLFFRLVLGFNTDLFNSKNKFICSEVIDKAYWTSHVKRRDTKHIGDIDPQELIPEYGFQQINPYSLKKTL